MVLSYMISGCRWFLIPIRILMQLWVPQNEEQAFQVCVSRRVVGHYKVIKFLYPNNQDDKVIITLHKQ